MTTTISQMNGSDFVADKHSLTAEKLDQLERDGYIVIADVISADRCDRITEQIERAWVDYDLARQSDDVLGVRFINNALAYSISVESELLNPAVLAAASAVLGDRAVLNVVNCRIPGPGALGQPLHDLQRRRGRPFEKCNAIWCLSDFTAQNGATRVVPGTHLSDAHALARLRDPLEPHPDEVIVEAPKGAVIFHNSHLIHSGRPNASGVDRSSIHAAYTVPSVPTHYDWHELSERAIEQFSAPMLDLLALREPWLDLAT